MLLVWGCFTYGGDYGESEEEALSKAPVWPVEISPPGTDAPVQNILQQPLHLLRLHAGVPLQKLTFLVMNISLVSTWRHSPYKNIWVKTKINNHIFSCAMTRSILIRNWKVLTSKVTFYRKNLIFFLLSWSNLINKY